MIVSINKRGSKWKWYPRSAEHVSPFGRVNHQVERSYINKHAAFKRPTDHFITREGKGVFEVEKLWTSLIMIQKDGYLSGLNQLATFSKSANIHQSEGENESTASFIFKRLKMTKIRINMVRGERINIEKI